MTAEIRDYCQNGEGPLILENTPTQGRFLDIGAFHPTRLSNVRALYERGWSGVFVEPSPGPLRTLLEAYGRDERVSVIGAAVGLERGLIEMHVSDDAYSTSHSEHYETWKDEGGFYGKLLVPRVTIEDLIDRFGGFSFVSIDAEGLSVDLLHRLLATPMNPACICVEFDNRLVEAIKAGQDRGYRVVDANGTNLILAR